jgi:ABC-type oligopeptide transport system substrate-binding subunit
MRRRVGVALLALGVGGALLGAPSRAGPAGGTALSSAGEAPKGGTLRMSSAGDVDFVDPALGYIPSAWQIAYATCAKLFNYPDAPGAAGTRIVPEVVDRFTVSRDRRTYTFELKPMFRFHTGARVTAQSFADAFNRVAQPRLESPATAYMREIVGAAAVIDGTAKTISGVRVLGRYRLRVRLTRPLGDFIARLSMPFFCPILPNTPSDPAGIDNPAGSGPYYVAERIVNQRIVLKRNPYYRGNRPGNVDQVVWTIETREACLTAVEEDRVDHCEAIPPSRYAPIAAKYGINRPGGRFFVSPGITTEFVAFNHGRPAFKGPGQIPLKKAINYAIDRPEMARAWGYLAVKRSDQMLPPALARPASIYPLQGADPRTARAWLSRARLRPRELVLYASSSGPARVGMAQVLAFNLKQIGVDVQVKYFDTVTLGAKATTPGEPFDLIQLGWATDYADGAAFFVPLLRIRGGAAGTNLHDPGLHRRLDAVGRLTGEERRKAWADLDVELMRDDPPWAPTVHVQRRTFVSRSVGCILPHPVYGFDIAAVCKK